MPRYLALDWDQQQLHLVEATVGGGAVRVQRAGVWAEAEEPSVKASEAQGRKLRERMKEAGIAAAPVLICLGRDRVILKDVRYPAVTPVEEPAIVRFQTIKELTDAPEDAVIDYLPLEDNGTSGDRHALSFVSKRERVAAYQAICRAAGLKLVGVTPRAFGMTACAFRLAGASVLTPAVDPPEAPMAILAVAEKWAEFCVGRGGNLVFTRSLNVGEGLAGEVRRNLALYNGQASGGPVQALYVAGMGEQAALRERLGGMLEIPVHTLDPFGGAERAELPSSNRGAFIGAVGLVHAQGSRQGLPINFAQPKQPRPERDPNRNKLIFAGVAAVLVALVGVAFCWSKLNAAAAEVATKQSENAKLDKEVADLDGKDKRFKAIKEWSDTGIMVLDEWYDLADRISDTRQLRVTELRVDPTRRTAKDKEKATATLTIKGVAKTKAAVDALADAFAQEADKRTSEAKTATESSGADKAADKHPYDVTPKKVTENTGNDKADYPFAFELPVKVEKREPEGYKRRLPAAPERGRGGYGF